MEGQLSGVNTKISELWESKIQVDEQIFALKQEAVSENVSEPLSVEVARQQAAVSYSFSFSCQCECSDLEIKANFPDNCNGSECAKRASLDTSQFAIPDYRYPRRSHHENG